MEWQQVNDWRQKAYTQSLQPEGTVSGTCLKVLSVLQHEVKPAFWAASTSWHAGRGHCRAQRALGMAALTAHQEEVCRAPTCHCMQRLAGISQPASSKQTLPLEQQHLGRHSLSHLPALLPALAQSL